MAGMRIALFAAAALALWGCDNGPSAVAGKQAAGTQMATADQSSDEANFAPQQAPRVDHRREAVKLVDGRPMWSASRRYSAEENAERAFDRNGRDFDADNLGEFVRKAHAFVDHPPKGTLTLERANGDRLLYDPKGNVFAVASKAGAPRTMFKPKDGPAYWAEQKVREAKRQTAARDRRARDRADDEA